MAPVVFTHCLSVVRWPSPVAPGGMSQGTCEHSCQLDDMALPGSDRILWEVSPKRYGHSECLFTRNGQEKKSVCRGIQLDQNHLFSRTWLVTCSCFAQISEKAIQFWVAATQGMRKAQISDHVQFYNQLWTSRSCKHIQTFCQNKEFEDKKQL